MLAQKPFIEYLNYKIYYKLKITSPAKVHNIAIMLISIAIECNFFCIVEIVYNNNKNSTALLDHFAVFNDQLFIVSFLFN